MCVLVCGGGRIREKADERKKNEKERGNSKEKQSTGIEEYCRGKIHLLIHG